jgi:hypothetical protein
MADHPWSAGEARWIRPFLRLQTDDPNGGHDEPRLDESNGPSRPLSPIQSPPGA